MKNVSQIEFESFVADHCSMSARTEPRKEKDGGYLYECYDDRDGNEVAFASWQNGAATYHVQDAG